MVVGGGGDANINSIEKQSTRININNIETISRIITEVEPSNCRQCGLDQMEIRGA